MRCLEMVSRGHEFSEARESCSCHKCESWRILRNYRALDAPPQRTVEQIAAELAEHWQSVRHNRIDGPLTDKLDELSAALERAKRKEV